MENNKKSEITKNTLATSLKKILQKKTLEKISIREIVEECGLNRQTFYYHFKDIYDLIEWILKKEALNIFDNLQGEEIWQEGLLKLLKYIDNNRTIFTNVLRSVGHKSILNYFYDNIYTMIQKTIEIFTEGLSIREDYSHLLTHYYILSFGSFIESWTLKEIDQSPEQLIQFLDGILKDQIRGTYARLLEDK